MKNAPFIGVRNVIGFIVTIFMVLMALGEVSAQEARCTELGTNCVGSEPLQMTSFAVTSGSFWNPNDSTTKQCGYEIANSPISRNDADVQATTDSTALGRLPTGHSVNRFMRAAPGNSGIFFLGCDINWAALGATYNARTSVRFYTYYSPDYNFRDDTPACHSKFLQGSVGSWHLENYMGFIHMYDFAQANWGPASAFPRDCCNGAPGATVNMDNANWLNRWFRVEVVGTAMAGPGWRTILYMKDITKGVTQLNGGVEFVAADTYGTDSGIQPWTNAFNTVVTSSPRQLPMVVNLYREVGGGQCNGWRGVSYYMTAGWPTDAGQRIGAASEIEGGSADTTPPVAPSGVNVSQLEY